MTADPDAIGSDGTVRLRCYLPLEKSLWFFAGCQGRKSCDHAAPISVRAAIQIMGSGEATVGELDGVTDQVEGGGGFGEHECDESDEV